MATQTTHYNLIKPASADRVYVGDLNDNSDTIDGYLFQANERVDQMADDYNTSSTYNTDDYVRRENYLYKCKEDGVTGNWDVSKWDRVKIMDEINQGGGGSSTLAGLSDVALSSPSNGQLLGYDSTTQKWKNVNGGGGGSSTFAGLSDVSLSDVANGDVPRFNSTTQKWENDDSVTELALDVADLQASVLTIKGDVQDIELDISNLSASVVTVKGDLASLDAAHLPYSSSKSTKEAIDEKADDYTFLTSSNLGSVSISIPQSAKELYIKIREEVETNVFLSFSFNILTSTLTSNFEYFGNGFYRTNNDYSHCTVYLNKDTITHFSPTYNGRVPISQYSEVYYR